MKKQQTDRGSHEDWVPRVTAVRLWTSLIGGSFALLAGALTLILLLPSLPSHLAGIVEFVLFFTGAGVGLAFSCVDINCHECRQDRIGFSGGYVLCLLGVLLTGLLVTLDAGVPLNVIKGLRLSCLFGATCSIPAVIGFWTIWAERVRLDDAARTLPMSRTLLPNTATSFVIALTSTLLLSAVVWVTDACWHGFTPMFACFHSGVRRALTTLVQTSLIAAVSTAGLLEILRRAVLVRSQVDRSPRLSHLVDKGVWALGAVLTLVSPSQDPLPKSEPQPFEDEVPEPWDPGSPQIEHLPPSHLADD